MTGATSSEYYFRQFLSGNDFARDDQFAAGMVNYAYAIGDPVTRRAVLVDPAYDPGGLIELVETDGFTVVGAFVTHYHGDHAGGLMRVLNQHVAGVAELLERESMPIYAQGDEISWLTETTGVAPSEFSPCAPGDVVALGDLAITTIATPGHTPGSQCLLLPDRLLTGDTLFLRGCGRTDLPGGDPVALAHSLLSVLSPLDPQLTVFAGHAYDPWPSATIGDVVATNPVFAELRRWHRDTEEDA